MGAFYSPDAQNVVDTIAAARKGFAPLPGPGNAYWSQDWVDDAAGTRTPPMCSSPTTEKACHQMRYLGCLNLSRYNHYHQQSIC